MTATRRPSPHTPAGNGAKIRRLLTNQAGTAHLYRTAIAGPSGQRAHLRVATVTFIDGTDDLIRSDFDIAIYDPRTGEIAGYANLDAGGWSITREHHNGELEWIGTADTLSLGADACVNGIFAATARHDHGRTSGGAFRRSRYVNN